MLLLFVLVLFVVVGWCINSVGISGSLGFVDVMWFSGLV